MRLTLAIALVMVTAGCTTLGAGSEPEIQASQATPPVRPVVVALVDTGANPYLDIFAVDDDRWVRAAVRSPFETVRLSRDGPILDRIERDEAIWNAMLPGVLYHFEGTRLFGISFDHDRRQPYVLDNWAHGSATSYLVAREAQDAIVLMVQHSGRGCFDGPEYCPFELEIEAMGMEWISDQPWIDLASVSLALPANPPAYEAVDPAASRYVEATRRAADAGKILLNGAGNSIAPTAGHFFNGPPWIIAVGGMEEARKGEHVLTGRGVDVVSNFSDIAPKRIHGEMEWVSGTSYATPIVAGTLARAIGIVREAEPERATTPQQYRDALNASAVAWNATDWDPSPFSREGLPFDLVQYANLPVLTQAQMGWGYVNGSFAEEIARRVLEEDYSVPPEKAQAAAFQPAWQRVRESYWSTRAS